MNEWRSYVCGFCQRRVGSAGEAQQHAGGMCGHTYGQMNARQYQPKEGDVIRATSPVPAAEGIWRIEGFGVAVEAPTLAGVLELAGHVDQLRAYVRK